MIGLHGETREQMMSVFALCRDVMLKTVGIALRSETRNALGKGVFVG